MELALSAMSAGGLVGTANQYLCLLVLAVAANQNLVQLSPQMKFMSSGWFIAVVALFWIITIAPAYSSLLAPGVMNTINTISNFVSGFVVPISSGLMALASVGIIANLNPELNELLNTIQTFGSEQGMGGTELMIAGGGAAVATSLTVMKGLAKPAISTTTGTVGHVSAPIYATVENVTSLVLMGLLYALASINPWLLVALLVVAIVITVGVLVYAMVQLWRFGKGIGKVMRLIVANPKAGLSVVGEFFVWGSGWLIWKSPKRGGIMLLLWGAYGLGWWGLFGLASLLPVLLFLYIPLSLMVFVFIGGKSAQALMGKFDIPDAVGGGAMEGVMVGG